LLRAGFAAWAVAETSFHLTTLSSAVPNWWTQTLWLLAYVLIGAALALPDVPEPPNRAARLDAEPADTSFLGIALLSVPMVLWRGLPQPANEESVLIVIAMALLAGLVWVRFSLLCRHMATVNAELVDLAYTDLASGARSRHYLDAALQVALADASEPAGTLYVLSLEIAEGLPGAEQDATLLALRRAMSSAAAAGDVVARVADHRFALLSRGASSPVARHTTAWRIQNELLGEITRQGMLLAGPPAVHIGTVVCAPAEGDARGLLDRATRRAERARREGVLVIGEDA